MRTLISRRLWLAIACAILAVSRAWAGTQAAIALPDQYSAAAAEQILRDGGNAIDAAVAAAFVLAVTYPEGGNLGGGGFMLVRYDGRAEFLDYRETAPRRATREMFLDDNGQVIAGSSVVGAKASGVPGTVAGLAAAHERYGSLPWSKLVEPAIALARDGFVVPRPMAERRRAASELYAGNTNFDRYFAGATEGSVLRQRELAETLTRIARDGAGEFYSGETSRLLVAEIARGKGLIDAEDLRSYSPRWREPLVGRWRDFTVLAAPPPSSGGFALLQLLGMKEALSLEFKGLELNSPQYVHLVAEIEKRVFADRAQYLGDPDFVDVPLAALLDRGYLRKRAAEVNRTAISDLPAVRPGLESHDTTHFSIVDAAGNAVANTYTLNTNFGNGVVVTGAGFLLNNEMDDFAVKPGAPNFYGVVGSTANEVQAGKRMLSSMSPTILVRGDDVAMVLGTPGGPTIFTTIFQIVVDIVDFRMTAAEAVAAPRFHHQLLPPDLVTFSPAVPLPESTRKALAGRGYRTAPHGFELGDVQVVVRAASGELTAASDPRGRGVARVVHLDESARPAALP
jgi:gamma-glutamyltranspeptidase/glutathione hydrolase